MNNLKVCLISSADMEIRYGSTTRPYYISKDLANKYQCEILHFCNNPSNFESENIRNIRIFKKSRDNKLNLLKDIFRIYKQCKIVLPDIIYPHQPTNALRALPIKYFLKVPLVYDAHSAFVLENNNLKNQIMERLILKSADKIIAPSVMLKRIFESKYNIDENKIIVIENGVDTSSLSPKAPNIMLKKELGISENDRVIVFTCPRINSFPSNTIALEYMFELIPRIESRIKNLKFVIIGGGPQLKPPSSNVIYTGYVQNLEDYINLGDLCVAPFPPSAVCGGTRNKVADYFSCGKAVVSTKEGVSGFDDARSGVDFLLAGNDEDFINKTEYILSNENIRMTMGNNARKLTESRYDWGHKSFKVHELFNSLGK